MSESAQSRKISGQTADDRASAGQESIPATVAKNEFGRILESVIRGDVVFITKHDSPKAVLMSVERFHSLSRAAESSLDRLTAEFDSMLASMQRPGMRKAMDAAFHAPPNALGRAAALAGKRKHG